MNGDVDLAPILQRIYENRFPPHEIEAMRAVWKVLVREFFQSRVRSDATILDVGAGACLFINEVSARRRIAVDANPNLAKFAAAGVEAIVTQDLSLAEVPDTSVGHAFLSNVLEHMPNFLGVLGLLGAIHRKLEPGGTLLVLQPNFRLLPGRYFDFIDHQVILTDASLREALESVGFEITEERVRFLPFTSKSALPKWPWLVQLYLRLRPAQWLFGKQTFVVARKRS
jgi:SAM-dependent methyltransferase